jgi:hypothetical protein
MLAYIPYMDPMGMEIFKEEHETWLDKQNQGWNKYGDETNEKSYCK